MHLQLANCSPLALTMSAMGFAESDPDPGKLITSARGWQKVGQKLHSHLAADMQRPLVWLQALKRVSYRKLGIFYVFLKMGALFCNIRVSAKWSIGTHHRQ